MARGLFITGFTAAEMLAIQARAKELLLEGKTIMNWNDSETSVSKQFSLLVVDRLYGCGKYVRQLIEACLKRSSQLLVRARSNVKSRHLKTLADVSCLVTIRRPRAMSAIPVRDVRGRIKKPGSNQWREVRIWTTLHEASNYPAMGLLKLYGFRWEQEIFYKGLKISLR